ncbi:MAG: non-ribosomal peptide synthetase, partial [bacterium]|nr:non-ribosomal peptide synthetase [bacterium]
DKMPRTSSGKVHRNLLPEPDIRTAAQYRPPENHIELKLVDTWKNVLFASSTPAAPHPVEIGIDDDFFKLGGHSLKATILVSGIHKDFQVQLPLHEIFRNPTIRQLARLISKAAESKFHAVEPAEKKEYYILSSAQKRLYILNKMNPDGTAYNMPERIPMPPDIDMKKLRETFLQLIRRHESLRTSFFSPANSDPLQVIHRPEDISFDIPYYGYETLDRGLSPLTNFVRPFELNHAPLLRAEVVQTAEGHLLLVDMHHIISDGISNRILKTDFEALYAGEKLSLLPLQYKDYA